MIPREFLSEREFEITLAFTYSFDPVFFERVVLPALLSGGTEDIHVLADGSEVDLVLARVHGPIHQLGRRYLLSPVRTEGRFHPKLVLRFGREEGRAWVSTGNLTHGGWGLNRELAVAWAFGPNHEDTGGWIRPLLAAARTWAPGALPARSFDRIEELSWLPAEPPETPRVLFSAGEPLADQLLVRWRGRRFDRLRLLTGSTDSEGAVLRWMADHFGVQEVDAAVTLSRCAWTAEALNALPVAVRLYCLPPPVLHAKAYHLSGPDGDVLLVGSADCTRSAWIHPPSQGGNVELLLIYEQPTPEDLAFFDAALEGEPQTPSEALRDRHEAVHEDSPPVPARRLRIDELQAGEDGQISVRIAHLPDGADPVELVFPGERIVLRSDGSNLWRGRPPDWLPPGRTAFAYVEAHVGAAVLRSGVRWLDDLRLLLEPRGIRRLQNALPRLNQSASPREDDALIRELSRLANELIADVQALRDPFRPRRSNIPTETNRAQPVDPETLIRSLIGLTVPGTRRIEKDADWSASLSGIFRAIFRDPDSQETEGTEVSQDEKDAVAGAEKGGAPSDTTPPAPRPARRVSLRAQDRFRTHMDEFVARLRSDRFYAHCTARQLVQAVGYPFAATMLGLRRGWARPDQARDWFISVAGVLLHGRDGAPPLLEAVRGRYEDDGALDAFEAIVGDGTLWTLMTVALLGIPWPSRIDALRRMLLVRDLWRAESLRAAASERRLLWLIEKYRAGEAVEIMRDVAGPIGASMSKLESGLRALCEEGDLLELQAPHRDPIGAGELIWGPKNDWALTLEPERDGKVRVYWPKRCAFSKFCRGFSLNSVASGAGVWG